MLFLTFFPTIPLPYCSFLIGSPNGHNVDLLVDNLVSLLDVLHPGLLVVLLAVLEELGGARDEVQGEAGVPPSVHVTAHSLPKRHLRLKVLSLFIKQNYCEKY